MKKILYSNILICLIAITFSDSSKAGIIGNDTTINVCTNLPLINGLTDSAVTVIFPDTSYKYEKIIMNYSISMPAAGFDPYDRIGNVTATKNGQTVEIARIMTPFATACNWTVDVTDFRAVLTDTVNINAFILYYITVAQQGYLVSISFDFTGGNPQKESYKIQNLWGNNVINDRWEYGSYISPLADSIQPMQVMIDPYADSVKVNINTSGHGEFNTDNCGEFCEKTHTLRIDSSYIFTHQLWRTDCGTNPCSPQNGTWQYSRAGWCPGSPDIPWLVDVTSYALSESKIWIEYWPESYHNSCSPSDSTCAGNPSSNCNPYYQDYGTGCAYTNGHTEPFFFMQSQIIFYRNLSFANGVEDFSIRNMNFQVYPNPAKQQLTVYGLRFTGAVTLEMCNMLGEKVYGSQLKTPNTKQQTVIDISGLGAGIYILKIQDENNIVTKKIIIE